MQVSIQRLNCFLLGIKPRFADNPGDVAPPVADVGLCIVMQGYVWVCRAAYSYVGLCRLCMSIQGYVELYRAMQFYVGLFRAVYGCVGLCTAMYGYLWLSSAMQDYVRLYTQLLVTNVESLYDAYTTYLPQNMRKPLSLGGRCIHDFTPQPRTQLMKQDRVRYTVKSFCESQRTPQQPVYWHQQLISSFLTGVRAIVRQNARYSRPTVYLQSRYFRKHVERQFLILKIPLCWTT